MKRIVSIKILIIDDSTIARKSIKENLRNFNIEFLEAPDAQTGYNIAISSLPDLILLDLNLPDYHGFEILKKIKAYPAAAHIPVIIITMSSAASDVEQAHTIGAQSYILKPVDPGKLLGKIMALLNITEEELTGKSLAEAQVQADSPQKAPQTSTFQKLEPADLKPGMELGIPVLSPEGNVMFKAGTVLDEEKISVIIKQNIKTLFIKAK
ncbi:MAG: response regulator [Brevinematales bacterium]|jgi:DNA-binding response OmpR family regulator